MTAHLELCCRVVRLAHGRHATARWRGWPTRPQPVVGPVRAIAPPPFEDASLTMPFPMLGVHPEESL